MDGYPLGLGLVVEDKPTEFSCTFGHCGKPSTSFLDKQSPQAWSPYKSLSLVYTCTKAGPCFFLGYFNVSTVHPATLIMIALVELSPVVFVY